MSRHALAHGAERDQCIRSEWRGRIGDGDGHEADGASIARRVVNGTLGHALDFDDVWADDDGVVAWRGHPSVCVLPAVLAAGESEGCDGATALLAYIIGVEIAGKLGTVFGPHLGVRVFIRRRSSARSVPQQRLRG